MRNFGELWAVFAKFFKDLEVSSICPLRIKLFALDDYLKKIIWWKVIIIFFLNNSLLETCKGNGKEY